ncbi:MAG TPA: succinylglutamate desuccinylase/aspartoacylase family protein [Saprospiraceae bacterium]|nr:succinylglutamate desuccinylase/aspartoacylase family protein [Saprospiraceae bacterium]HMX88612.1 succinylglutamate desuccinylase/aspartoacylase family protein [Saprospiraceae bacterium]HMZ40192.1 succinylglutamate desuccinylase/aspartoacylase family protein [Saprospiraceae bacterium]HNA63614.1 succinylglutamate desuccinylase/aspartoacylase family protein [Saprospiraceae bacterium]HNB30940.1 succinylglutamate desuccinylase/aspartoacylase family protein [Saprospiraceae bacterium]
MTDEFILQNQHFPPGSSGMVRINAGSLPSGNRISIFAYVFRSKHPGPVVLFMGGMHGDEINGTEIVRRSIQNNYYDQLLRGTVICIPLLNIYGFINFSRDVPDGKDVNRSFPGSSSGSLASRVARIVTKKILPLIDFGIDFHTGARDIWNYPHLRYSAKSDEAQALARMCHFPLIVSKPSISKSLRRVARDLKKTILVFEGGEALRLENFVVEKGLTVIRNILMAHQMIDGEPPVHEKISEFRKLSWERSPDSGIITYQRKSGNWVKKGELLAVITDPFAQRETRMYASKDAFILGQNNAPVVNLGDGMFNLANTL